MDESLIRRRYFYCPVEILESQPLLSRKSETNATLTRFEEKSDVRLGRSPTERTPSQCAGYLDFLGPSNADSALWPAWEFLRLDGSTGMSNWWRDLVNHDVTVPAADGPFKGCKPVTGGHTANRLNPYHATHRRKGCPHTLAQPPTKSR